MATSVEPIPNSLLASLYEVLDDQEQWPEFLHGFCDYLGTTYAAMLSITYAPAIRQFVNWGLTDEDLREYCTYWVADDPWAKGKDLSTLVPGTVVSSVDACSDSDLEVNECYLGFLKPRNLHYGARAFLLKSDRICTTLATLRPKEAGPFTSAELGRMRSLVPHLQRVLRMQDEAGDLVMQRDILRGLLDQTAASLILLDQSGAVLTANASARAAMERGKLLFTENRRLRSACNGCDRVLREAIQRALDPFEKTPDGEIVSLGREPSNHEAAGPRLRLLVVPARYREKLTPSSATPAAIVHIIDVAALPRIDQETLRRVFSLSKAEAAVAVSLAHGLSIAETADDLHVSRHTVRSHLKNLFLKTETTRQSALVSLILRLQAPLLCVSCPFSKHTGQSDLVEPLAYQGVRESPPAKVVP